MKVPFLFFKKINKKGYEELYLNIQKTLLNIHEKLRILNLVLDGHMNKDPELRLNNEIQSITLSNLTEISDLLKNVVILNKQTLPKEKRHGFSEIDSIMIFLRDLLQRLDFYKQSRVDMDQKARTSKKYENENVYAKTLEILIEVHFEINKLIESL